MRLTEWEAWEAAALETPHDSSMGRAKLTPNP